MWVFCCRRRRWPKFSGDEKYIVRLEIERHRSRPSLRGQGLHHAKLIRRVFVNNGQRAIAIGAEDQAS